MEELLNTIDPTENNPLTTQLDVPVELKSTVSDELFGNIAGDQLLLVFQFASAPAPVQVVTANKSALKDIDASQQTA